jgi:uncharacterized protein (TIGR00369 family)
MDAISDYNSQAVSGPQAGFRPLSAPEGRFLAEHGPFMGRLDGDVFRLGLRIEDVHANAGDIAHGGLLMAFADSQMVVGAMHRLQDFGQLVTVNMTVDFVRPGTVGGWLEGGTTIVRATRNLVFVETMLTVDGETALRVSGILKRSNSPALDPDEILTDDVAAKSGERGDPKPPAGYRPVNIPGGFLLAIGPLHGQLDGDLFRFGLRIEERHCNVAGLCHGGTLMTVADMQLGPGSMFRTGNFRFKPTMHFSCDFVSSAREGDWLYGETNVIRMTRNMLFSETMLYVEGEPVMRASGINKIVKHDFELISPDAIFA